MKTYYVKKINEERCHNKDIWSEIPTAYVECFPWNTNDYMPKTEVKLFYTDTEFRIKFVSYEKNIRAVSFNMNDPVFKDSCVEFFLQPNPLNDDRYMNFEINAIGTLLLGVGKERPERIRIKDVNPDVFQIKSSVNRENVEMYKDSSWSIEYIIPFSFIEKHYGNIDFKSGFKIKGNFYKCGDETEKPHYGCWNPIVKEKPDFHRPDFFGDLILE